MQVGNITTFLMRCSILIRHWRPLSNKLFHVVATMTIHNLFSNFWLGYFTKRSLHIPRYVIKGAIPTNSYNYCDMVIMSS